MSVKMKPWNMKFKTRQIVSEAINFSKQIFETYNQKVTVRQIYYHLFSKGLISLTQNDYQKVVRLVTQARLRGYIPFEWIEDRSRHPLWNMLYDDISDFLSSMLKRYRKNTWYNQENFIIILVEKDALAPIVWDIAKDYNVFVFPTKGFSSWSMFVEDIRTLANYFGKGKRLIVLVLSDLDPSGLYIGEDYVNKFKFMTNELGFSMPYIERVALTEKQVKQYNLPWIKKKYRNEVLEIVELDALPPEELRKIVKEAIEKHINLEQLQRDKQAEVEEKEYLESLIV